MRRKRPRASWALLGISVLVAGVATTVLHAYLARLEARAADAGPGRPTVIAAVPLSRGSLLEASRLRVVEVPERFRPPGAFDAVAQVSGRLLAGDVAAGEAITATRIGTSGGPVAALVPLGLRAVAVRAAVSAGSVIAGDRVDVLATYLAGQPRTETVAPEAEVLRVQPEAGFGGEEAGGAVVVLVGPETAERLAYASSLAELSIAIVGTEEVG